MKKMIRRVLVGVRFFAECGIPVHRSIHWSLVKLRMNNVPVMAPTIDHQVRKLAPVSSPTAHKRWLIHSCASQATIVEFLNSSAATKQPFGDKPCKRCSY